jgi:phage recombination protein Bet
MGKKGKKNVEKEPVVISTEKVSVKQEEKKDLAVVTRVLENKDIAPQDAFGVMNRKQLDLIKRTVAIGASDDELRLFIQVCKGANLNPFLRQAHFVPFWDSKTGTEKRAIIIGIDGFRAIAEGSGKYAGNDDAIFDGETGLDVDVWEGKGAQRKVTGQKKLTVPSKATVSVYKIMEGQRFAFTASARWAEYYPGGKKGARWHDMPFMMLGKCAEALALRKAFPKQLSGMYEEAEMSKNFEEGKDDQRVATAFDKLMMASKKMSVAELEEYKAKIEKSDKYTLAQKNQFKKFADGRIAELQADIKK